MTACLLSNEGATLQHVVCHIAAVLAATVTPTLPYLEVCQTAAVTTRDTPCPVAALACHLHRMQHLHAVQTVMVQLLHAIHTVL